MARKSRKTYAEPVSVHKSEEPIFQTAVYVRLSVENGGRREDADSLENQKSICMEYIQEHSDLRLTETYEDNGRKGTDFERPGFVRLMEDIRSGKIRCVVVKDLSRFGRNYIEAGQYLEKIFPFLGVRFIAVTDGYDSLYADAAGGLMLPLKNMINTAYAKDISRKIISSFRAKQEKGEFLPAFPPYGYLKDKERGCYVVDEETAVIVRKIFGWCAAGDGVSAIQRHLEEINAITPAMRKVELGFYKAEKYKTGHWPKSGIANILKDRTYTGCIVYGKRLSSLYQGIPSQNRPEDEWKVFPDMHEPIISQELFDRVQAIMNRNKKKYHAALQRSEANRSSVENVLDGKVYCGDCGRFMRFTKHNPDSKKKNYSHFYCSTHTNSRGEKCSGHYTRYSVLLEAVGSVIQEQVELAEIIGAKLPQVQQSGFVRNMKQRQSEAIRSCEGKVSQVEAKMMNLYESLAGGVINEEEYLYARSEYVRQKEDAEDQLKLLRTEAEATKMNVSNDNPWLKAVRSTSHDDCVSKEAVEAMVEKILVYKDKRIEIVLRWQAEKHSLEEMINRTLGGDADE